MYLRFLYSPFRLINLRFIHLFIYCFIYETYLELLIFSNLHWAFNMSIKHMKTHVKLNWTVSILDLIICFEWKKRKRNSKGEKGVIRKFWHHQFWLICIFSVEHFLVFLHIIFIWFEPLLYWSYLKIRWNLDDTRKEIFDTRKYCSNIHFHTASVNDLKLDI